VPASELYVPLVRVVPPSSVGTVAVVVRPAASLYAVVRSFLAVVSKPALVVRHEVPTPPPPVYPPLVSYIVPVTSVQVNPVIPVPPVGLRPISPIIAVVPVSEMADPPRTAKLSDVKRSTLEIAANTFGGVVKKAGINMMRGMKTNSIAINFFIKVGYKFVT
jgi:hypothetical protein